MVSNLRIILYIWKQIVEGCFVIIFSLEYLLRLLAAPEEAYDHYNGGLRACGTTAGATLAR
eukprot:COSAG05_NODE_500_length_9234_cov_107.281664_16_plen_61_part_00